MKFIQIITLIILLATLVLSIMNNRAANHKIAGPQGPTGPKGDKGDPAELDDTGWKMADTLSVHGTARKLQWRKVGPTVFVNVGNFQYSPDKNDDDKNGIDTVKLFTIPYDLDGMATAVTDEDKLIPILVQGGVFQAHLEDVAGHGITFSMQTLED